MRLGAHESIAGGLEMAFEPAMEDGCECLQIFSKNANQWSARPLEPADVSAFRSRKDVTGIRPVAVHDSYLINLAQPDDRKWRQALNAFADEVARANALGCEYLIFHPGAHLGTGVERGLARIAEALNEALDGKEGAIALLETTAGQGTVLGYEFDQLSAIIDRVDGKERIGVCYDTCHTFTAGLDIRTPEAYAGTFESFDSAIGLERLRAFHLNDSARPFASRKDRHAQIGDGEIGLEAFRMLVNDARFSDIPGYLETPPLENGDRGYRRNIDLLRSLRLK